MNIETGESKGISGEWKLHFHFEQMAQNNLKKKILPPPLRQQKHSKEGSV